LKCIPQIVSSDADTAALTEAVEVRSAAVEMWSRDSEAAEEFFQTIPGVDRISPEAAD
jgi:hypothetical protein